MQQYKKLIVLVSEEMQIVDKVISRKLSSNIKLIEEISNHIICSGGKRLRPILLLMVANALGSNEFSRYEMAAVIEFIHTATLLHDDVIDMADMRRGKKTANAQFGNSAAVLVGDFLYTRAFQMMVEVGNLEIMSLMADAVNIISQGEVLQLINIRDQDIDEESYIQVIQYKTAKLFEAATQTGAILAGASAILKQKAAEFGHHLGIAFQLRDDWLDYASNNKVLGKNVGTDLREGKLTLPLILLRKSNKTEHQRLFRLVVESKNETHLFNKICTALQDSGALEKTFIRARSSSEHALEALSNFPESPYKEALIKLCHYAVIREN